ncbi:MAG: rod shape-determining protein MreC [Acidobacteria bacterium]|nr:rod shape-determining protein MreC [Acidobacteriota bacterium]MBI3470890.1 rod shape-determining protein MreC [Candidatus Solibacter usitatus]
MDTLLNRYRNLTILLLTIVAQLLLLAYQVKSNQDVRLIRVWAVTAVTPLARTLEAVRSKVADFMGSYISMRDIRAEHRQLQSEVGRLKMENQHLKTELATADRAGALAVFQSRSQSRTVAARVIGTGAGTGSSVRFVDRGFEAGVQKGMAVVTPDGIVGKVTAVFPLASQILLISDGNFGAGVISQKGRVRGTLRGIGYGACRVDNVPNEAKVEIGELFYTTGDDRVFPKGMPVGPVKGARPGPTFQDVIIDPAGFRNGIEEVLIVLEGAHQQIPEAQPAHTPIYLTPPPPAEPAGATQPPPPQKLAGTDADRLRERYKAAGEAQHHQFGEGGPGAKPPDFSSVNAVRPPAAAAAPAARPPAPPPPPQQP